MRRELMKRLAQVEQYRQDDTVRQISDLMDELSAEAAGTTVDTRHSDLMAALEGGSDATP
ncbi:MAG: hypothetical protein U9Q35_03065 [Pseudomonadota bacterium]|nr:hypothetical protein [Pseudomonadota bacterium]